MKVSRRWLEAFLRRSLDPRELAERLAMLGAPVDAIHPRYPGLDDLVVGLVREVRPHPNADRLRLCTVDDGGAATHHVVCGAPNVAAGKRYPFARLGVTIPTGMTMEKRKIRGEVSEGMLCSAKELGLGQDHEGILELATEAAPGTRLSEVLDVVDDILDVDVTPNRPDLLGHKGLARELAAAYQTPFRLPTVPGSAGATAPTPARHGAEATTGGVRVAIGDVAGCPRLLGAVVRGVRVGPSPEWLRRRVESVGMRSINCVVDATNYVMLELNQPMHAYDVATLKGPSVVARRAMPGEKVTTLDGVDRGLTGEMTVIADDRGVIGVAGVMGGAATEVGDTTRDIFLECAYFDPARIRRTRRALGLSSEASYRFERGVDRWGGAEVLRRCVELIQATAGGTLEEPPVDLWPQPSHPPRIFLRPARVAQVLGVELPWPEIERHLVALGATVVSKPEDGRMAVDVPGWRPDVVAEIDLIEEVARLHGYQNFPAELRPYRVSELADAPTEVAEDRVRAGLVAQGLYEVVTIPMGSSDEGEVRLRNPLSMEEACLRAGLLPGLARCLERNWAAQTRDVRLFEIGTVFRPGPAAEPPLEERRVAALISGGREPAHWTASGRAPAADLWDLRGLFAAAVALANPDATVQVDGAAWVARRADGTEVGRAMRLELAGPPWAGAALGLELAIDPAARTHASYRPIPTTPAAWRDLALVLPAGVSAGVVEEVVRAAAGNLLERLVILDEYRGPGLPAGARSVAFRLVFRAADRTLRDDEVDEAVALVLGRLAKDLGVMRREAAAPASAEDA